MPTERLDAPDLLATLLLSLNQLLIHTDHLGSASPSDPELVNAEALSFMYRSVELAAVASPGMSLAHLGGLGALACSRVAKQKKHGCAAFRKELATEAGLSFPALRGLLTNALGIVAGGGSGARTLRRDFSVDIDSYRSLPPPAFDSIERVFRAVTLEQAIPRPTLDQLRSPRASWPVAYRFRPFLRFENKLVCWDNRALGQIHGPYFGEVVARAFPGLDRGRLANVWSYGMEHSLDHYAKGKVRSYAEPTRFGAKPTGGDGKICDRLFVADNDLFLVEIKNTLTATADMTATGEGVADWLKGRAFEDEGVVQLVDTARRLHTKTLRIGGRAVMQFERVWLLLLMPVSVPMTANFTRVVEELAEEKCSALYEALPNLRPPVLMSYLEFISWISAAPYFKQHGRSLGDVLLAYLQSPNRPFLLSHWISNHLGALAPLDGGEKAVIAALNGEADAVASLLPSTG